MFEGQRYSTSVVAMQRELCRSLIESNDDLDQDCQICVRSRFLTACGVRTFMMRRQSHTLCVPLRRRREGHSATVESTLKIYQRFHYEMRFQRTIDPKIFRSALNPRPRQQLASTPDQVFLESKIPVLNNFRTLNSIPTNHSCL